LITSFSFSPSRLDFLFQSSSGDHPSPKSPFEPVYPVCKSLFPPLSLTHKNSIQPNSFYRNSELESTLILLSICQSNASVSLIHSISSPVPYELDKTLTTEQRKVREEKLNRAVDGFCKSAGIVKWILEQVGDEDDENLGKGKGKKGKGDVVIEKTRKGRKRKVKIGERVEDQREGREALSKYVFFSHSLKTSLKRDDESF
jgi:hypothetical protein